MLLSWKLWTIAFCLGLALLAGSALCAVRAVAEALQSTARSGDQGFGGPEDALDGVSRCCRFSMVDWERRAVARWAVSQFLLPAPRADDAQSLARIRQYFALGRGTASTELALQRMPASPLRAGMATGLQALQQERNALRPGVQRAMVALVARALAEEGLAPSLPPGGGQVFPPVAFTLVRPPSVLVVSPRERIRLARSTVLQPGLSDQQALQMEGGAEALGWSALVEPTGGYSTYPTIITEAASLDFALSTAVHEWAHTYLFFRPLGFNYFKSEEMRTINETTANIVGREVGRQLMSRHFEQDGPRSAPAAGQRPAFDFRKEMRETRMEAERLLAQGSVAAAEQYMEERRLLFVEQGYAIRKLNQAYFAFHGTYADSPASVSPIGPQLERLFQQAGSVAAFLRALEGIGSAEEYRRLLTSRAIEEATP
ncbi:MAG: hypothetical protein HYY02_06255 [Chloroflexi bacterium]|nr:hypothetical protein [Chloroflexota bacterium]